jgi:hypothetical protein
MTSGYRSENAKEQKAMIRKLHRVIFRLRHSCLVTTFELWFAVGLFHMDRLTYSIGLF